MFEQTQNTGLFAIDVYTLAEENLRKEGEANSTTTPTQDEGDWNTDGVPVASSDEESDDNSGTITG